MDDFGGAEATKEKALDSFVEMGKLLKEVGIEESEEKAEGDDWEWIWDLVILLFQGPSRG